MCFFIAVSPSDCVRASIAEKPAGDKIARMSREHAEDRRALLYIQGNENVSCCFSTAVKSS